MEQSTLAPNGLRTGTLGTVSSLAFAAPLAEGDYSETARTSASRIGWYFDRTASVEKLAIVVMGTERLSIGVSSLTYNGAPVITGTIGSNQVAVGSGTSQVAGASNFTWDGTSLSITTAGAQLIVGNGSSGSASAYFHGAAGTERAINFRTGSSNRWRLRANTVAEGGSNAGSNLELVAYDDAGTQIDIPLSIARAAGGAITVARTLAASAITCTTLSASAYVTANRSTAGDLFAGYFSSAYKYQVEVDASGNPQVNLRNSGGTVFFLLNTTGLAVGANGFTGSERLRVSGGTATTPAAGDVCIGNGEIRAAGAVRANGLITVASGYLEAYQASGTSGIIQGGVNSDANPRFQVLGNGTIRLGDGTVTPTAFVDASRNVTALTVSTTSNTTTTGYFAVSGAAATSRQFRMQTSGVDRWIIRLDGSAESGSNAGSAWQLLAYDDAGSYIDGPISIVRASGGLFSIGRPVSLSSTLAVTGRAGINGGASTIGAIAVATASETDLTGPASWSNKHCVLGGLANGTSVTAFGVAVNQTNNDIYTYALSPGVAWRDIRHQAANHYWHLGGSATPALGLIASGALVLGTDPGGSELLRVGGSGRFSSAVSCAGGRIDSVGPDGHVRAIATGTSGAAWLYAQSDRADYGGIICTTVDGATARWAIGNVGGDGGINFYTGAGHTRLGGFTIAGDFTIGTDPGGAEIFRVGGAGRFAGVNLVGGYWLSAGANGSAAPTPVARSAGTKIILYDTLVIGVQVDAAIGIEPNYCWFSMPNTSTGWKWYAGTSVVAQLEGSGALTCFSLTATNSLYCDNIQEAATNAVAAVSFNYRGYAGGTTQFRNVDIYDGKTSLFATFVGSTRTLAVSGPVTCTTLTASGGATPGAATSGQTLIGNGSIRSYGNIYSETGSLLLPSGGAIYAGGNLAAAFYSSAPSTPLAPEVLIGGGQIKAGAGITCASLTSSGNVTIASGYALQIAGSSRVAGTGTVTNLYCGSSTLNVYSSDGATLHGSVGNGTGTLAWTAGITCATVTISSAVLTLGTAAQIDSSVSNTVTDARWQFQNGTSTHAVLRIVANNTTTAYIDTFEKASSSNVKKLAINEYGGDVYIGTDPGGSEKFRVGGSGRFSGWVTAYGADIGAGGIIVSAATTASNGSITIASTDAALRLRISSGGVTADKNQYEWRAVNAGTGYEYLQLRKINDANTVFTDLLKIQNTGDLAVTGSVTATGVSTYSADGVVSGRFAGATGRIRLRGYVDATNGAIIDSANTAESAYLPLTITGSVLRLFGNSGVGITVDASGNVAVTGNVTVDSGHYFLTDQYGGHAFTAWWDGSVNQTGGIYGNDGSYACANIWHTHHVILSAGGGTYGDAYSKAGRVRIDGNGMAVGTDPGGGEIFRVGGSGRFSGVGASLTVSGTSGVVVNQVVSGADSFNIEAGRTSTYLTIRDNTAAATALSIKSGQATFNGAVSCVDLAASGDAFLYRGIRVRGAILSGVVPGEGAIDIGDGFRSLAMGATTSAYGVLRLITCNSDATWYTVGLTLTGTAMSLVPGLSGGTVTVGVDPGGTEQLRVGGGGRFGGDLYITSNQFRLYGVTTATLGFASASTTSSFLNLRNSSATSYGYVGGNSTDFGITDASGNFVLSYQPGSTRIYVPATTSLYAGAAFTAVGAVSLSTTTLTAAGANGRTALANSYFGYSTSYRTMVVGSTGTAYLTDAITLAFNVDVSANTNSAFSGNGSEYIWRNAGSFITPNAANTAYTTLYSWNSSGVVDFKAAPTVNGVAMGGTIGGSATAGQIAYGSASNTLTSSANLTYSAGVVTIAAPANIYNLEVGQGYTWTSGYGSLQTYYVSTATSGTDYGATFFTGAAPTATSTETFQGVNVSCASQSSFMSGATSTALNVFSTFTMSTTASIANIIGIDCQAQLFPQISSTTGTATNIFGAKIAPTVRASSGVTAVNVTSMYGLFVLPNSVVAAGVASTIGSYYGLYLGDLQVNGAVTPTVTDHYGIAQVAASAKNYFAGKTSVGASPITTAQLYVYNATSGGNGIYVSSPSTGGTPLLVEVASTGSATLGSAFNHYGVGSVARFKSGTAASTLSSGNSAVDVITLGSNSYLNYLLRLRPNTSADATQSLDLAYTTNGTLLVGYDSTSVSYAPAVIPAGSIASITGPLITYKSLLMGAIYNPFDTSGTTAQLGTTTTYPMVLAADPLTSMPYIVKASYVPARLARSGADIGYYIAVYPHSASGIVQMGSATLTSSSNANTIVIPSSGSFKSLRPAYRYTTSAASGNNGGIRGGVAMFMLGSGARNETYFSATFSLNADTTGFQMFIGFNNAITLLTADPSTMTTCVGLGCNSADAAGAAFYIVYGNGTAQARIATSIVRSTSYVYKFEMYYESGTLYYRLSAQTASATYVTSTGSLSANIPVNTALVPHLAICNGTAASHSIDVHNLYIESGMS